MQRRPVTLAAKQQKSPAGRLFPGCAYARPKATLFCVRKLYMLIDAEAS